MNAFAPGDKPKRGGREATPRANPKRPLPCDTIRPVAVHDAARFAFIRRDVEKSPRRRGASLLNGLVTIPRSGP